MKTKLIQNEFYVLLIIALILRLLFWFIYNEQIFNEDAYEYWHNSRYWIPSDYYSDLWGYTHWYQRSPAYTIFLSFFTSKNSVILTQIILSVIGTGLLFKLNKTVGWIWGIVYIQDIGYPITTNKETVLIFLCILSIYLLYNKQWYLVGIIPLIITIFTSFISNQPDTKFMWNIWELWKPSFNMIPGYNPVFLYLQMPLYIMLMFTFIRKVKLKSPIFVLCLILTFAYGFTYGQQRYREPLMSLILLTVIPKRSKLFLSTIEYNQFLRRPKYLTAV